MNRSQIALNQPIKTIGMHTVLIALHPEVDAHIVANVARSEDEAERQARGEDVTRPVPARRKRKRPRQRARAQAEDEERREGDEAAAEPEETAES